MVAHWEIGGSGRTAEEVRDRVTGVRAFRALWGRLSSYAVPVVSQEKPERSWERVVRCALGRRHSEAETTGGLTPSNLFGERGGDGGGNSVRVHPLEGLVVVVVLSDAIDEVGGDQRSEAGLQGVPDVARAWVRGDGRVGGMVWSEGTEEELGAEHGQMEYWGLLMEMVGGSHLEEASGDAKGWVLNGLQGGDSSGVGVGEPDWGSVKEDGFN